MISAAWTIQRWWLTLGLVVVLAGCAGSPGTVSGQLPLVDLESLEQRGDQLLVDLRIRNLNDQRLESPLRHVRLSLNGEAPVLDQEMVQTLSIAPRGREIIRLTTQANSATDEILNALSEQRGQSLPYQLTLTFEGRRASRSPVEQNGFLHPVPGQPGRFR